MDVIKLILFLLVLCIGVVVGDELCYDVYDGYFYCEYGCCGSFGDEYCCGVYTWIIAVAVIGTIILVSVIVVIVCVVYKKKTHKGRVINPNGQTQQVTTIQHVPTHGYQTQYQTQPGFQTHPTPMYQPGFQNQPQGPPPPQYPYPPASQYPPQPDPAYPPQ